MSIQDKTIQNKIEMVRGLMEALGVTYSELNPGTAIEERPVKFVTYDGVPMYEGDKCYYITKEVNIKTIDSAYCYNEWDGSMFGRYYHSKELAIAYLNELNTPPVPAFSFTTADRVVITNEGKMLFGCNKSTGGFIFNTSNWLAKHVIKDISYTWFSTIEARDKYIQLHQKNYSIEDVIYVLKNAGITEYSRKGITAELLKLNKQ